MNAIRPSRGGRQHRVEVTHRARRIAQGGLHNCAITKELGDKMPGEGTPAPVTIKRGSRGDLVRAWQRVLGVVADGIFGPNTELATTRWQLEHNLPPDGVVQSEMWKMA